MLIFNFELCRSAEIGLYDLNGDEETEKYMLKHFSDCGSCFRRLTTEEKNHYGTAAEYGITDVCYKALVDSISVVQTAIDNVSQIMIDKGWSYDEAIAFGSSEGCNFLI